MIGLGAVQAAPLILPLAATARRRSRPPPPPSVPHQATSAAGSGSPWCDAAANLTADQGAGPLYRGRDLPFFLEALPGQNVSFSDGKAARGWLQVPNRSNSTGAVCAKGWQNPPLAAQVVCRALGWTGVARAAGAPAPENSTTIGPEGVSWESLRCDGTEAGPLGCRYKPVEVNFTGCLPRARLVIECYQDPGGRVGAGRGGFPQPATCSSIRHLPVELWSLIWPVQGSRVAARCGIAVARAPRPAEPPALRSSLLPPAPSPAWPPDPISAPTRLRHHRNCGCCLPAALAQAQRASCGSGSRHRLPARCQRCTAAV